MKLTEPKYRIAGPLDKWRALVAVLNTRVRDTLAGPDSELAKCRDFIRDSINKQQERITGPLAIVLPHGAWNYVIHQAQVVGAELTVYWLLGARKLVKDETPDPAVAQTAKGLRQRVADEGPVEGWRGVVASGEQATLFE